MPKSTRTKSKSAGGNAGSQCTVTLAHLRPQQRAFIAAFSETGTVTRAAVAAQVSRRNHSNWLEEPEYAEAFAEARKVATDVLIDEARRRAIQGVRKPIMYQGAICRDENGEALWLHEYSDNLLMFLIKAEEPEKFRENARIEHTGAAGAPISIEVSFVKPA